MTVIDLSGFGKLLHSKGNGNKVAHWIGQHLIASGNDSGRTLAAGASAGSVKDSFQLAKSISELLSPACGMTEEEKSAYLGHIRAKLMAGKRLTDEEMRFLQAECPELYMQAARVQNMRASFEQQLKSCKSREEAASLFSHSMSMIGEEDPMKEAIAAYQEAYQAFQSTGNDSSLPQTAEEDREKESFA